MPSKTKNRRNRNKTKNGKKTRGQRGGNFLHTISFGLAGTPDAPSDSSVTQQTWAEWAGIKSDPSGKSWWERLTSSSPTVIETNTNPMQSNNISDTSDTSYTSDTSSISNSDVVPDTTTYNPMNNKYGGKKSKSKSSRCSRKHKHSKSCFK
jgi:hypothetical protein